MLDCVKNTIEYHSIINNDSIFKIKFPFKNNGLKR